VCDEHEEALTRRRPSIEPMCFYLATAEVWSVDQLLHPSQVARGTPPNAFVHMKPCRAHGRLAKSSPNGSRSGPPQPPPRSTIACVALSRFAPTPSMASWLSLPLHQCTTAGQGCPTHSPAVHTGMDDRHPYKRTPKVRQLFWTKVTHDFIWKRIVPQLSSTRQQPWPHPHGSTTSGDRAYSPGP
jgi:hypothetical protein